MLYRLAAGIAAAFLLLLAAPALAAPPLEAYGRLPGVDRVVLSPTGKLYAIVGEVAGKRQLLIMNAEGRPVTIAPVGELKVRDVVWAGDERVLVFTSMATGLGPRFRLLKYEVGQLLVLNLKTGENYWAMSEGGLNGNGVWGYHGVRRIDGRWYAFLGGLRFQKSQTSNRILVKDSHPDLFRLDLDTGETRLIDEDDAGNTRRSWMVGADGKVDAIFDYDQRTGAWKIRAPGKAPIATGVDTFGDTLLAGKGRTEGTVLYRERGEGGEDTWYEARMDTGEKLILFRGVRIAEQYRDHRNGVFIGYRRDSNSPDTRFFDEGAHERVEATELAFPGQNMRLRSWNETFDRFVVQTDGPEDSGTWWFVDIKTGKASEIGRTYPKVRGAEVGPVRMVSYRAADGLEMEGVLTLPPGRAAQDLPLVVLPHDGPQQRDYPQFNWLAQAFASRGYAVFQPNFRGSEGYGAEFREAGYRQWGRKMQTDISDGVAELARQGIVDPGRACIMGQAYGGYAALAGVTLQRGLYRCAVGVAPISDLARMRNWLGYKLGRVGPGLRSFSAEVGTDEELHVISPARQAARADAPVLLIHGKDDTEVPPEQSRVMEKALRAAGRPVEFIELPGEDHWLSREDTRLAMLRAAVAFVEKHNPAG
ncbi:MAG TPA: S9 family peptidase [Caulobacteraceae bacterium]|nr:S9 family peptidase [Caulobacteraceae bacterium]